MTKIDIELFRQAAFEENGEPISAGYVPPVPGTSSDAVDRFRAAALAEGGQQISAGWPTGDRGHPEDIDLTAPVATPTI
jgi:hypothetical protein